MRANSHVMGSIVQNHDAPAAICDGGDQRPPKRKKSGPRRPSTACATSKVGASDATNWPMDT